MLHDFDHYTENYDADKLQNRGVLFLDLVLYILSLSWWLVVSCSVFYFAAPSIPVYPSRQRVGESESYDSEYNLQIAYWRTDSSDSEAVQWHNYSNQNYNHI